MTRDDETMARNFSEVLLALRAAGEQGIHAPTIAQLAPFYPTGLPRNPRSIARTLVGLSNHDLASYYLSGSPHRYFLTDAGRVAADMIRLARQAAS